MTRKMLQLVVPVASMALLAGCATKDGSVADVPPPSSGSPITASHDSLLPPPAAGKAPAAPTAGDPSKPVTAASGPVKPAATIQGNSYVVRQGDTLWSIAKTRYGDGKRYKDIITANPGLSADRLQAGAAINLP